MTGRLHRRLLALGIGACLSVGALTGCGKAEMRATEPLDTSAHPALTQTQVTSVLDSLTRTIAAGDDKRTAEALEPRFEDPALAMRVSQYRLNAADNSLTVPTLLTDSASLTVSLGSTWPRAILDVTKPPESATPLVLVVRQDNARSPFKLWQWMHLLPGQSVPSTAAVATGAKLLPLDKDQGLALSPARARDTWPKAIVDDKARKDAGFDVDEFMANIREEQKNWKQAIGNTGSLSYSVKPAGDVMVFADEDDGALVATSYSYRTDVAINDGEGGVQMGGDVGATLGEEGKVTGKAHWTYTITVLIHIPADSASGAQTRVIAGEKVLTEATRD